MTSTKTPETSKYKNYGTKEETLTTYVDWLRDNKYCYRFNNSVSELYNPINNTAYGYYSEQLVFQIFKRQNHITNNVTFNDDMRQACYESLPIITETVFNPDKPHPLYMDNNLYYLNLYEAYQPSYNSVGDIALWHEFMERLFPVENERVYIELFMAHMFQRPSERPTFGLMLTSEHGTGKGKLYSILECLLNNQSNTCNSFDDFTNRFSVALHNNFLCLLDDVIAKGDKQMSTLKSKITEPRQKFEMKGQQPIQEDCYTRIILASNDRRPLKLEQGDRRWYCPQFIKHKVSPDETADFIEQLSDWLDADNGKAYDLIYNYLTGLNISSFNAKKHVKTETLEEMIGLSKSTLETEIEEYLSTHPAFGLKEICSHFDRHSPDLIKDKLVQLDCHGIAKEVRLLRNHPDYPSNERHVYRGDRQAAIDYLVSEKEYSTIPF